jgi:hypothetical protein
MFESQREIFKFAEEVRARYESFVLPLIDIQKSLENIDKISQVIADSPIQKYFEQFKNIGQEISEHLKKTPESLTLLANYGWYLNFDSGINLPNKLGQLIQEDKIEDVDEYLIEYYNENVDRMFNDLSNHFPERKEIFIQILASHKQKQYYLAIPCILAQIDGICFDSTTRKFFIKEKKNKDFKFLPEIAEEFANISSSVADAFSRPIFYQTPISSHESKLDNFPVQLNRHLIMHGLDKNYGNEKNSLKCMSLLFYLSDMLTLIDK